MTIDLSTLTAAELDALEAGVRKVREDQARQRAAQRHQSGPRAYRIVTYIRCRRNGQMGIPLGCDSYLDAVEEVRSLARNLGLASVILVAPDQDFDAVAGNVPDKTCIFIVQEKREFFGGPVKGRLSPPVPRRKPIDPMPCGSIAVAWRSI